MALVGVGWPLVATGTFAGDRGGMASGQWADRGLVQWATTGREPPGAPLKNENGGVPRGLLAGGGEPLRALLRALLRVLLRCAVSVVRGTCAGTFGGTFVTLVGTLVGRVGHGPSFCSSTQAVEWSNQKYQ